MPARQLRAHGPAPGTRRRARGQLVACALLVFAVAGGRAAEPAVPGIPPRLQPPAGQVLALSARAQGVQIYICSADVNDPTAWHWALQRPEAELFDAQNHKIGSHFAGPTWEALDGSRIVGEVVARDDGPDADAIPWLLLRVKQRSGRGVLDQVQSIQRAFTVGGMAPVAGCSAAKQGAVHRSPYSASYYFYTATAR